MKSFQLLIRGAREVVYFDHGQLKTLTGAYIVMDNGRIGWMGQKTEFDSKYDGASFENSIDAENFVVLPGLIDSHTHTVFAGSRENEFEMKIRGATYQEIAAAGGGIKSTMRSTRQASREELLDSGKQRLRRALEFGITTLEIKSGYGLTYEDEIRILEVIAELKKAGPQDIQATFLGAHTVPPEFTENRKDYIDLIAKRMIPEIAKRSLADFCDVFCETNVFTPEETRFIFSAAQSAGMKLRLHADQLTNTGGAELAVSMNALSADHLEHISEQGIETLRDSGTVAGLLPGCSFFLNMRFPPARKLIDAGIPVALATDFNPGTCPTQNLQLIMSIACTQMRMTPAEAIAGVTLHAARSLGRTDIGNVRPGMQADLALFEVPGYKYIPYHYGQNHIARVIKNGQSVI